MIVYRDRLRGWAEKCPDNFQDKYALVSAEVARLTGQIQDAEAGYEEAIEFARRNGFLQCQAIANELAARFYYARGIKTAAISYLKEARLCYLRWGADRKVAQLDRLYPVLQELQEKSRSLDMMTVFKASQAIAKEVVLERLLETLMRVVVEAAGRQRRAHSAAGRWPDCPCSESLLDWRN